MLFEVDQKKIGTILAILILSSCSLEKEYPLPCIADGKQATKDLCLEYRKRSLDEPGKIDVLKSYGFNERDAEFILSETSEGKIRCKAAVVRQCDLISLRNGVGY